MKKLLIGLAGILLVTSTYAGSLKLIPNEMAFPASKLILNTNTVLLSDFLTAGSGAYLTPYYVWVGSLSTQAVMVAIGGDVTINTNGSVTIGFRKVTNTMMPALSAGQMFVGYDGNVTSAVAKTISGAFSMATTGVATLTGNIDIARVTNLVKQSSFAFLPTSTNGLVNGQLWLSNNFVTVQVNP